MKQENREHGVLFEGSMKGKPEKWTKKPINIRLDFRVR